MNREEHVELQEFYEKHFERGDRIPPIPKNDDFMYALVIRELRSYLRPNSDVLDLGCNTGNLSLFMALHGCNVLGIDIARNAIETARKSAKYYQIHNVRFEAVDFVSERVAFDAFDFILCSHVVEHVPRDDLFLRKLFVSTKSGGTLLLITPTIYSSYYLLNKHLKGYVAHDQEVGHLRRYSRTGICSALEAAGFDIKKVAYLDSILRDWFILDKKLRRFNSVWGLPLVRKAFNSSDSLLGNLFLFPSAICVHAQKRADSGHDV
jgi:2-polyprenyl-3-methyl-5-hydroxy-6-metoxy-1,4-benzoquinol methylase